MKNEIVEAGIAVQLGLGELLIQTRRVLAFSGSREFKFSVQSISDINVV